jgi:C-terminal processing protease CtpA/Prc
MKRKYFLILGTVSLLALGACKKENTDPPTTPPTVPPTTTTATRQQLTLDSIFLYAKEIYYWNDKLPTYEVFNPRQYTTASTDLANYENALLNVAKYSNPFEWVSGSTEPKFSYIFNQSDKNPTANVNAIASVDLEGNGNDIGIRFGLYGTETNYKVYVTAVYENSPAEKAGFKRGDVISKVNGTRYGSNYGAEASALNNALNASPITLEGVRNDGTTTFNNTLTKAVFKSSPIYKTRVIEAGAKKIGYLAYARFSNAENSNAALEGAFSNFASTGVTDLVIDLRYNGGGYVSTAENLVNLIAPSGTSGVMFSEYFNSTMQSGNADILKNQPLLDAAGKLQYSNGKVVTYDDVDYSVAKNTTNFAKKGALGNVRNIVFIISGNTASASELVINSLKPHMTVKLVGKTSYGKPIGFFPITLENKYDVYFSLFETKNSAGQGGYYAGMTPDYDLFEVPSGTAMYDFGDVNDNYLKKAIEILAPGQTVTNDRAIMSTKKVSAVNAVSSSTVINAEFVDKEFKGMVENRFKLKQ